MADWFQEQALSGSLLLAVPVALVAGLVSFFSPCVIPLLPGYLSYTTGLSGADLGSDRRGRMLAGSLLFVAGLHGRVRHARASRPGRSARGSWSGSDQLSFVLGMLMILLGLAFAGWLPYFSQREWRVHSIPAVGPGGGAPDRLPLRPRVDAVPRPDPGRHQRALLQRGAPPSGARC